MDIMIKPIVTEKATQLTEQLNRYTFRVSLNANKYQIKSLVEKLYGVKVVNVNTLVVEVKTSLVGLRAVFFAVKLLRGRKRSLQLAKAKLLTFIATYNRKWQ